MRGGGGACGFELLGSIIVCTPNIVIFLTILKKSGESFYLLLCILGRAIFFTHFACVQVFPIYSKK